MISNEGSEHEAETNQPDNEVGEIVFHGFCTLEKVDRNQPGYPLEFARVRAAFLQHMFVPEAKADIQDQSDVKEFTARQGSLNSVFAAAVDDACHDRFEKQAN